MRAVLTTFSLSRFALVSLSRFAQLLVPLRRARVARAPIRPARMDPATHAALLAEAERIAAPLRLHVQTQLALLDRPADEELGGDFPEVDALLRRAGLLSD